MSGALNALGFNIPELFGLFELSAFIHVELWKLLSVTINNPSSCTEVLCPQKGPSVATRPSGVPFTRMPIVSAFAQTPSKKYMICTVVSLPEPGSTMSGANTPSTWFTIPEPTNVPPGVSTNSVSNGSVEQYTNSSAVPPLSGVMLIGNLLNTSTTIVSVLPQAVSNSLLTTYVEVADG